MTPREFAHTICQMPAEQQNAFFEELKGRLCEEEWLATVQFISLCGLYLHPGKYNAMKEAMKEIMFEEIFGHEYTAEYRVSAKSLLGYENPYHFGGPEYHRFGIHK